MKKTIALKIAALMVMVSVSSIADSSVWLNMGGVSWHPGTAGMNGRNGGMGLEWSLNDKRFAAAGMYHNSLDQTSHYIAHGWRAYQHNAAISGGMVAGVIDGYQWRNGRIIPLAAPYITVEGTHVAVNVIIIPKIEKHIATTVAFQIKFKVR